MEDIENFLDNILEHSETWESHINMHTWGIAFKIEMVIFLKLFCQIPW